MGRALGWSIGLGGLLVAQLMLVPGVAHAATDTDVYRSSAYLNVLAEPDKVNQITIVQEGIWIRVTDAGDTVTPGYRCQRDPNNPDTHSVLCESGGLQIIVVNLRDLDDMLTNRVAKRGEFQAGPGKDLIDSGSGNDEIHGQAGDDVLIGRLGADVLLGEDGNDTLRGNDDVDGNDTLNGGDGGDRCVAEPRDAKVFCER